ncbi:MAG: 30S ribosomal protein S6 [Candidatus Omnitrophica bacterium]|nr:30S ribosomal protein S6 [Candidatus Omnitrophota bacterium]
MERVYESMIIVKPDLSDEEREGIFSKLTKKVEDLEGKIASARVWAKERKFSYPIKSRGAEKKRNFNGCYWLVNFTLDTEKLPDLKEVIRLEERILRDIIIKKDESKTLDAVSN